MELKDVILSTLDEIEKDSKKDEVDLKKHIDSYKQNTPKSQDVQKLEEVEDELDLPPFLRKQDALQQPMDNRELSIKDTAQQQQKEETKNTTTYIEQQKTRSNEDEIRYLENIREKMLVLFEGFQSPNNKNIEAKLDLTINFLEYILSTLDERLDKLKKE